MRIEDVEVVNLRFEYPARTGYLYAGGQVTARVTSLVLIHTDTGETGIGAAYAHPDLVRTIIEGNLRAHLIGEDPADIDGIWNKLYGLTRWYGRKGAAMAAVGGVDIAFRYGNCSAPNAAGRSPMPAACSGTTTSACWRKRPRATASAAFIA
jgi:L-alanine-DL-glutamate epimerase-like enolase superfamily enzyme